MLDKNKPLHFSTGPQKAGFSFDTKALKALSSKIFKTPQVDTTKNGDIYTDWTKDAANKLYTRQKMNFKDGVMQSVVNYIFDNSGECYRCHDTMGNIKGTDQKDVIYGNYGDDKIEGRAGDDTLMGGVGSDTYVWSRGDGNDTIIDREGSNSLVLKDLSPDDVEITRDSSSNNKITIKATGEIITASPNVRNIIFGKTGDVTRIHGDAIDNGSVTTYARGQGTVQLTNGDGGGSDKQTLDMSSLSSSDVKARVRIHYAANPQDAFVEVIITEPSSGDSSGDKFVVKYPLNNTDQQIQNVQFADGTKTINDLILRDDDHRPYYGTVQEALQKLQSTIK